MSDLELNLSSLVERQESPASLVRFEDTSDENVPRLRYSVPLPGGIPGRHYIHIVPRHVDWRSAAITNHDPKAENIKNLIKEGAFTRDGDLPPISEIANVEIVTRRTTDDASRIDETLSTIRKAKNIASGTSTMAIESKGVQLLEHYDEQPRFVKRGSNNDELFIKVKDLEIPFSEVSSAAKRNKILTIYQTYGGNTRYMFTDIVTTGEGGEGTEHYIPSFVIIEHYKLSSFFEDYGAGKTLGVFSLMPGEETTIKERHWRRSDEKEKSSASVFDSFTEEARNELEDSFETENTDKAAYSKSKEWHVKAKAECNFGVAGASVEGGAAGSTAAAREQLGKNLV